MPRNVASSTIAGPSSAGSTQAARRSAGHAANSAAVMPVGLMRAPGVTVFTETGRPRHSTATARVRPSMANLAAQ